MSFYHVYSCLVSQMQMLLKTFLCRRDDIFGRYFGMILLYFGMKVYFYYFFNWQADKTPVLDQLFGFLFVCLLGIRSLFT